MLSMVATNANTVKDVIVILGFMVFAYLCYKMSEKDYEAEYNESEETTETEKKE